MIYLYINYNQDSLFSFNLLLKDQLPKSLTDSLYITSFTIYNHQKFN